MGTEDARRPMPTPKAVIHQKYGSRACYRIEEVREAVDSGCPGLAILQQHRSVYRCVLDLPDLSVASGTFPRKKDAEHAAAMIAIEKLGIDPVSKILTPGDAWNELVARISFLFGDEFLSSSHPLVGHFSMALTRTRDLYGIIPMSVIAACDAKVTNLCRIINSVAETDPHLVIALISKAAEVSDFVCTIHGKLSIRKNGSYSPEAVDSLIQRCPGLLGSKWIEAIHIPSVMEEQITTLSLHVSDDAYYMDEIAQKLGVDDSSQVLISRTVGKASSEVKLYFCVPEFFCVSSTENDQVGSFGGHATLKRPLNNRASYLSGQTIFGDAILANVGYTWKGLELFFEDVNLCAYYRMLLGKLPNGYYKLSRKAILAAELPAVYTARSNWKGPSPRDLLCAFCRQQRLSEPLFSTERVKSSENSPEFGDSKAMSLDDSNRDFDNSNMFVCEVKILSKTQEPLLECSFADPYGKEYDAIQSAALKVLYWFYEYFKQLNMPMEKLSSFGSARGIKVHPVSLSREFSMCLSIYGTWHDYLLDGMSPLNIEGPDSGVLLSFGSLACISYAATLVKRDDLASHLLEENDEFEFEIGIGAVIPQLEACVTQLSINHAAQFITELPSRDIILAAANHLSQSSLSDFSLEFSVKLLRVTEPPEERMEKALFSPPLSKQRVEFAVRHINESHAATLVDFGCGSGSLLDCLLECTTSLEKIIGVDISRKSLTRAAKILQQKLSKDPVGPTCIKSAVLYGGSITDFDSHLYGCDIGTCLEVIEHMEEDQACLFGDIVLSSFCPRVLILSTPNYEYNPVLQKSTPSTKVDEQEEKPGSCRFRNHDHKFEWTRGQFENWAAGLAGEHGYSVEFSGVGGSGDVEPGFASQIAVFRRNPTHPAEIICSRGDSASHPYELIWEWTDMSRSSL